MSGGPGVGGHWIEPVAGFEYRPDTVSVSADQQRDKLAACGIDAALFGDAVDPSFFIGLAIHAGIASGVSAEGNVNMLQSLVMHRRVAVAEPLRVRGRITAVTPVPRGHTIDTDVWFEGGDGRRAITARRRSLKPDPRQAGARGAGDRPPPVVTDPGALQEVARRVLSPDRVKAYSMEGNSIHYEPAAARAAGFRAPIIGGGMGVHFLMAALWARFRPRQLDLDVYFRRPIFWDATCVVAVDEAKGGWRAVCLLDGGHAGQNGSSKVLTEARVNRID